MKPYYSRSRRQSIDLMSEKELAIVKQRALSQASIIAGNFIQLVEYELNSFQTFNYREGYGLDSD